MILLPWMPHPCNILRKRLLLANTLLTSNIVAVGSAKALLSSSTVELQAIPTPLVQAPLHTVSVTNVTMVIPAALAPVTRGLHQDNVHDTSDPPCIDLLGGEMLPPQLHSLSADQESKKFYPLDPIPQDVTDPLLPSLHDSASLLPNPCQANVDSSEFPMSNAMLKSTISRARYLIPMLWPKLVL